MILFVLVLSLALSPPSSANIHTVFTTECTPYFTWQSLGFMLSWKLSQQPGNVTRLLSCTEDGLQHWQDDGIMPTHIAPSWTLHPRTGDVYSGINKPVAVMDWLEKTQPVEEYILILDADMIMLKPFDPVAMGVRPGWAVSAFYGYLQGVSNELALKHVPHVAPRTDTLAGPVGRRGDQVGGFTIMRTEDLKRVNPLWIKYSEDVRADPDAWNTSGDAYTKGPGDKPWIAEMYGYSFGAAAADMWHLTDHTAMLYPSYLPYTAADVPNVLHYGLLYSIKNTTFSFDKHWYQAFDALRCPPWDEVAPGQRPMHGLFPIPPQPSALEGKGEALLRDLLSAEVITTLNEALCQNHKRICPPSAQLLRVCGQAREMFDAVRLARRRVLEAARADNCTDLEARCPEWAARGECGLNPTYMLRTCKLSCNLCKEMRNATSVLLEESTRGSLASNEAENVMLQLQNAGGISAPPKSSGLSTAPRSPGDAVTHDLGGLTYVGSQIDPLSPVVEGSQLETDNDSSEAIALDALSDGRTSQERVDEEVAQLQQQHTMQAGQHEKDAPRATNSAEQGRVDAEASQLQTQGFDAEARGAAAGMSGAGGVITAPTQEVEPLRGIRKFQRDMELLKVQVEREDQVRLCTADPSLTFAQVKDCLVAVEQGKIWKQPADALEVTRPLLEQVLPEDVVEAEEDTDEPTSFGGWLFGTSPGQGCLVLVAFVILSAFTRRKPKRSPLLRSYARID